MQASGPVDDRILISQFCESMDAVTKKIIKAKRAENPQLTFAEIFKEVYAKFTKSAKNTSRVRLETISLKSTVGGRLTMREFENFDAEFRILKSECPEIAEDEAKRLYQRALPTFLIESLQKELLKKEKYPKVIFVGHAGHTPQQIKMWLDQTFGTNFGRVAPENVGLVVQCQDKSQMAQILTLDGRFLQTGEKIHVRAMDPQLSLEDMRQICRETLQPRENAQEIKSSGPLPQRQAPRPSAVAALAGEE